MASYVKEEILVINVQMHDLALCYEVSCHFLVPVLKVFFYFQSKILIFSCIDRISTLYN